MVRAITVTAIAIGMISAAKAQTSLYASPFGYPGAGHSFTRDSLHANKKWSFSHYASLSAGYSFFRGGSAAMVAVPLGIQLNRQLTNHVFAFAGLSAAPAYVRLQTAPLASSFTKETFNNPFSQPIGKVGMFSRAELGLGYTNDAHTFTISGSIGIERNSYPVMYYPSVGNGALPLRPSTSQ